jgi:hypothetical protein
MLTDVGALSPRSRSLPQVHVFRLGITARSCCSFNFLAIQDESSLSNRGAGLQGFRSPPFAPYTMPASAPRLEQALIVIHY